MSGGCRLVLPSPLRTPKNNRYPNFPRGLQDIDHLPLPETIKDRHSSTPEAYNLWSFSHSFESGSLHSSEAYFLFTYPVSSFPCQQRSTLVDAQACGLISASTLSREDDQFLYLGTRLPAPIAKKIPLQREVGEEQAIWRATKKLQ